MAAQFKLEVFDNRLVRTTEPVPPNKNLDDVRLQAYEQGYKAGWDDAAASQSEDQTKVSMDFAHNLQELSFTFLEAKGQILKTLEPLLTEMVTKVLPKLATENLVEMVVAEVQNVARSVSDSAVELVISPENRTAMESLLERESALPITIVEEPSMGTGQVYMRFEDVEKKIDLEAVLTRCQQVVEEFFKQNSQEAAYG